ncbi:MAG: hypothetical protein ACUVQG_00885 [Thermogutta sp.]
MRGKLFAAVLAGLIVYLGQWAWAEGGRFDHWNNQGPSIQLVGHGYYSSYSHYGRSYGYGWHHPPVVHPPAVVIPFPGHPPVVITPPTCHPDYYESRYRSYYRSSDHGAIGIYGPRFGFSIAW